MNFAFTHKLGVVREVDLQPKPIGQSMLIFNYMYSACFFKNDWVTSDFD